MQLNKSGDLGNHCPMPEVVKAPANRLAEHCNLAPCFALLTFQFRKFATLLSTITLRKSRFALLPTILDRLQACLRIGRFCSIFWRAFSLFHQRALENFAPGCQSLADLGLRPATSRQWSEDFCILRTMSGSSTFVRIGLWRIIFPQWFRPIHILRLRDCSCFLNRPGRRLH